MNAGGANTVGVLKYQYDTAFNLIETTDPLGRTRSFSYDAKGNVTQTVDPAGNQLSMTYDPAFNQLTSFHDSRGNVTTFVLDNSGTPSGARQAATNAFVLHYFEI